MFNNVKLFVLLSLHLLFINSAIAAPKICIPLDNFQCQNIFDDGPGKRNRGYVCFVVKDDPNLTGVITLKNTSGRGDWDVLVGRHFDTNEKKMYGMIPYQNNKGTTGEILWLPGNSYDEYIVVAYPTTSTPSHGCLIFHRINTGEIAGQAFIMATAQSALEALFSNESDTQKQSNDKSRAIASGLSVINRNNLAQVGYDLLLNEISLQLSNAFGGGSWFTTFGVNYFGGFLEQSGKFLFDDSVNCQK